MENLAFSPEWDKLSEKQKIELHTADKFLAIYNKQKGSSYKITAIEDSPDIACQWEEKNLKLYLEITLTEDRKLDIASGLGRKQTRSLDLVCNRRGYSIENPIYQIIERIKEKTSKRYGENVALIVRHVSGVDWDFEQELESIRDNVHCESSPFDQGIWLLSDDKLTQIC